MPSYIFFPLLFCRWVWESQADGSFTVYEDTDGELLERGTEIRIHLKDEASEYADEDKLKVSNDAPLAALLFWMQVWVASV